MEYPSPYAPPPSYAPPLWWAPGNPPPPPPPRRSWALGFVIALLVLCTGFGAVAWINRDVPISARNASQATVDITAQLATGEEVAGTGMLIGDKGVVVTNNHVVAEALAVQVQVDGTGPTYNGSVVGVDVSADVAVIQLAHASGLPTIPVDDSSKVRTGQQVEAVGNALGRGGAFAVTQGRITQLDQSITATDEGGRNPETLTGMMQFSGLIQPGDSGGPLLDQAGRVVGMNTAGAARVRRFASSNTSVGFAIPINTVLSIAHRITSGQSGNGISIGKRGILGVGVDDSGAVSGIVVVQVQSDSPASRAGIQDGDRILSINGKSVATIKALSSVMSSSKPGDHVAVGWIDTQLQSHQATVTLAPGPLD